VETSSENATQQPIESEPVSKKECERILRLMERVTIETLKKEGESPLAIKTIQSVTDKLLEYSRGTPSSSREWALECQIERLDRKVNELEIERDRLKHLLQSSRDTVGQMDKVFRQLNELFALTDEVSKNKGDSSC
jgi:hypothetical protein